MVAQYLPLSIKLPSEDFKQGQKFAETAFTIPTAAVEREKGSKIRVTPKLFGQPGTVDVDIIEEGEDVGYKNIAQRFANDLIISGSDIAAGLSEMMRDMGAKQAKGIAKITGSKQAKEFAEKNYELYQRILNQPIKKQIIIDEEVQNISTFC